MRHISPQLCAQLSCISLLLIFSSVSVAQIRPLPGTRPDMPNREWALGNLRKDIRPNVPIQQQARILLATLKDDFRQLQIVNNDLMQRTFVDLRKDPQAISGKEIRSILGEIRKRAERLRTNLRLPEVEIPEAERNQATDSTHSLSSGLMALDRLVMKFVENPIFQQPGILDTEQSTRAAEDLCRIVLFAEALRKLAKEAPLPPQLARQVAN